MECGIPCRVKRRRLQQPSWIYLSRYLDVIVNFRQGSIFLLSSNSVNLQSIYRLQLFRSVCCGGEEIAAIEAVRYLKMLSGGRRILSHLVILNLSPVQSKARRVFELWQDVVGDGRYEGTDLEWSFLVMDSHACNSAECTVHGSSFLIFRIVLALDSPIHSIIECGIPCWIQRQKTVVAKLGKASSQISSGASGRGPIFLPFF